MSSYNRQTSFNICMPEIKNVSKLLFMICYNSCFAKTQQILKNAWMQCYFIIKKGRIIVWMAATGIAK